MDIFAGFSKDGIHWDISDDPIVFHCDDEEIGKKMIQIMIREYVL